jgi:hypothetical protein
MTYEIWDKPSGNRIGRFTSGQEAFGLVYKIYRADGEKLAADLVLVEYDGGHVVGSTEGDALLERALTGHQIAAG